MRREAATDDLLAKKLRAEGAHAHDVRDGVGVPALGQHRHGDDATDVGTELAGAANRVHHLAKNVGVCQLVDIARIAAQPKFPLERFDLTRSDRAEIVGQRLAGVELLAVDQQGAAPRQPSTVVVDVREKRERSGNDRASSPDRRRPLSLRNRDIQSAISFEVAVLLQTTMNTGGRPSSGAASQAR